MPIKPIPTGSVTHTQNLGGFAGYGKGGKVLEEASGLTLGAKRDFAGGMREPEALKSLTFIHSENVAGRGIQRHESDVSEIVTYQLKSNLPETYILVHLTSDGLVTDCDLVEK
ncbi:hypothetical protein [Dyadobacter alkalitolerans]|uniref:hypothetical protein n=1 Tax=Dyadobacter alkalitolerans TaxID=492736 RepID=UPI00146FA16A|nr:hypothetical protein [Dyadobacter alkalitolerans]